MPKIYVETRRGVIDQDAATNVASVLTTLADQHGFHQDGVFFTSDEHGAHFVVVEELYDLYREVIAQPTAPAPKRRGRPPKSTTAPAAEEQA